MKKRWTANRVRLARARSQIEALEPQTLEQSGLKQMLLALIPLIDDTAGPGMEAHFETAWELLERCRATWNMPEVWQDPKTATRLMKTLPTASRRLTSAVSRRPAGASRPSGCATSTSAS